MKKIIPLLLANLSLLAITNSYAQQALYTHDEAGQLQLTTAGASHLAGLPLRCMQKEFPYKTGIAFSDASLVTHPKDYHPAFYGCYDWHSSVHGHWMLERLLKSFPDLPESSQIRAALNANLTAENIQAEVAYLKQPNRQSFERTYGWAWALKLAEELNSWNDADGKRWAGKLQT